MAIMVYEAVDECTAIRETLSENRIMDALDMKRFLAILVAWTIMCGASVERCKGETAAKPAGNERLVKVFIVAGQSNAVGYNRSQEYKKGRTEFPQELSSQPDVLFWLANAGGKSSWTTLRLAGHGAFGPEISFARDIAKSIPDAQIAIVKCAVGGTGIARSSDYSDYIAKLKNFDDHGNNWHPPSSAKEAGKHYQTLIANVRDAVAALEGKGQKWELAGCLWMQGEHEAGISRKMAEDYDKLLAGLIKAIRTDLKVPSLKFAIGEVNSHKWAFADIVRDGQVKVCRDDANALLVKTVDLSRAGSGGAAHFDADGMVELGSRFASTMRQQLLPKKKLLNHEK